jgi:hypothetical protein
MVEVNYAVATGDLGGVGTVGRIDRGPRGADN